MRRIKMVGAAGALVSSALVGGTMISAALAAPATTPTTSTVDAHAALGDAYTQTFLDTLASQLGVDTSDLGPAALAAANAAIDAAAGAGDLTTAQADEMKANLARLSDPASILLGRGALAGGPGHGPRIGLMDAADAAATALGMDTSDLIGQLRDGTSLNEVAVAQGVSYSTVVSAVTDAVSADLASAVSDGRITQDRADQISSALETWLNQGGQPADAGFGFWLGLGLGHRGHHGPMGDWNGSSSSSDTGTSS